MPHPDDAAPGGTAERAPGRATGVVATLLGIEQRARASYVEHVRSPRLAAIDQRLQHAYGVARRAGAVPIYLRQRLTLLQGECAQEHGTVATWGRTHDLRSAVRTLFDGTVQARDA